MTAFSIVSEGWGGLRGAEMARICAGVSAVS